MITHSFLFLAAISLEATYGAAILGLSCAIVGMWRRMLAEFAECKTDRDFLRFLVAEKLGLDVKELKRLDEATHPEKGAK